MKTVRVTMSDEAHTKLQAQAKADGLPGIASLLLKSAGQLTEDAEAANINRTAILRAKKLPVDSTFRLRDLFPASDWERFSKGARLRAGREFVADVRAKLVQGVRYKEKTQQNHHVYVRTR
ncbi:MAG TPA: DUF1413 domain-containing protein [Azospirillaceae bacterium]|nr:DUF1413 domain-containing protein [Azospirillaceae bacterium]